MWENLVLAAILANCVTLAMYDPLQDPESTWNRTLELMENVFLAFFTLEVFLGTIAQGVFFGPNSYMSNPWNWLDVFVVFIGYVGLAVGSNLSALRTLRAIRPLRTIKNVPGVRLLVVTLLDSLPLLLDVSMLLLWQFVFFGIVGVQLWAGRMQGRCFVEDSEREGIEGIFTPVPSQWLCDTENGGYGRTCATGEVCLDTGQSPNNGYTNFDNILWAALSIIQILTLQGSYEILYFMTNAVGQGAATLYHTMLVLLGHLFGIQLLTAVLSAKFTQVSCNERYDKSLLNKRRSDASSVALLPQGFRDMQDRVWTSIVDFLYGVATFRLPGADNVSHAVESDLFSGTVIVLITCNTLTMSIEHYGMSDSLTTTLNISNIVFTTLFGVEMFTKLYAMGLYDYFSDLWNTLDAFVTVVGLVEIVFQGVSLTALRTFRLLRVFRSAKLLRNVTSLRRLMETIVTNLQSLQDFLVLMMLFMLIFGVLGLQSFGNYALETRERFDTFGWSCETLFVLLTGSNWYRVMWAVLDETDGSSKGPAIAFFVVWVIVGHFVLLSLFLAILIENMQLEDTDDDDDSNKAAWSEKDHNLSDDVRAAKDEATKAKDQYMKKGVRTLLMQKSMPQSTGWGAGDSSAGDDAAANRTQLFVESLSPPTGSEIEAPQISFSEDEQELPVEVVWKKEIEQLAVELDLANEDRQAVKLVHEDSEVKVSKNEGIDAMFQKMVSGDKSAAIKQFHNDTEFIRRWLIDIDMPDGVMEKDSKLLKVSKRTTNLMHKKRTSLISEVMKGFDIDESQEEGAASEAAEAEETEETGEAREEDAAEEAGGDTTVAGVAIAAEAVEEAEEAEATTGAVARAEEEGGVPALDVQDGTSEGDLSPSSSNLSSQAPRPMRIDRANASKYTRKKRTSLFEKTIDLDDEVQAAKVEKVLQSYEAERERHAQESGKSIRFRLQNPPDSPDGDNNGEISPTSEESAPALEQDDDEEEPEYLEHTSLGVFAPDNALRMSLRRVVEHPWFDNIILAHVVLSCITLALEEPGMDESSELYKTLRIFDLYFIAVFSMEMVLKVIVFGFCSHPGSYLRSSWNVLDFVIVLSGIISLFSSSSKLKVLRSLRMLRAMRPLRMVSRLSGMRVVVNSLLQSAPSVFHVFCFGLFIFLIFAILAVELFGGALHRCNDSSMRSREECTGFFAPAAEEAVYFGGSESVERRWQNTIFNFDSVPQAAIALFVVATMDEWETIMYSAIDARGVDLQPERDHQPWMVLFFICFIALAGLFWFNLFVGVIINHYLQTQASEGGLVFITASQKQWQEAVRLGNIEHANEWKRNLPEQPLRRFCFRVIVHPAFDYVIISCIIANTLLMTLKHEGEPPIMTLAIEYGNVVFFVIFVLEAMFKIIAVRWKSYWADYWNRFDFIILLLTLPEFFTWTGGMGAIMRVFRIGRLFKLVRSARGLRTLFNTFLMSLPAIYNVGALLFVLFFVFAVIGMELFGEREPHLFSSGLNAYANFGTFQASLSSMFRICIGDGWSTMMRDLMGCGTRVASDDMLKFYSGCDIDPLAPIFFVIFRILASFIMLQLIIAIILEKFIEIASDEGMLQVTNIIEIIKRKMVLDRFIANVRYKVAQERLLTLVRGRSTRRRTISARKGQLRTQSHTKRFFNTIRSNIVRNAKRIGFGQARAEEERSVENFSIALSTSEPSNLAERANQLPTKQRRKSYERGLEQIATEAGPEREKAEAADERAGAGGLIPADVVAQVLRRSSVTSSANRRVQARLSMRRSRSAEDPDERGSLDGVVLEMQGEKSSRDR